MPYNGSGTYVAPSSPGAFNPATSGGSATPTAWNTLLDDIEAALSTVICSDGQSTVTANIPMASHKFTGLADGSAAQDSATFGQTSTYGVRQVVSVISSGVATGATVIPFDDSIPQITEGDQYMTLAITPSSATSALIIDVVVNAANNTIGAPLAVCLFQDATANALAAVWQSVPTTNGGVCVPLRYTMLAGTTSATTFRVRAGSNTGTTTFNGLGGGRLFGGVMASSIVITEKTP